MSVTCRIEPQTYYQACGKSKWELKALADELQALELKNT